MSDDKMVVFVTTANEEEAARIGRAVVEAKLAACANILPRIRSIYRWEGAIHDEAESFLVLKSRSVLFEPLEKEIRRLHSYNVPEVIAVPIDRGSDKYLQWIETETHN